MPIQYGIIGAGNGGQAFAAYLGLKGYKVHLFDIDSQVVNDINQLGGVTVKGKIEGFSPVESATTKIEDVIKKSDVILIIAPANAHRTIARNCAEHLRDNQIIILNPGATAGCFEFRHELNRQNCTVNVILAETQSLLFACRLEKTGLVEIFGIKENLGIAAFPSKDTDFVLSIVSEAIPEWIKIESVMESSLSNMNAMLHPAPSLFNLSNIESKHIFMHYTEGITSSVGNFIEKMDKERLEVGLAYGLNLPSGIEVMRNFYGTSGKTITEHVRNNSAYKKIKGAESITNRFFTEDLPMGLVPISEFAKVAEVPTPNIDALIQIISSTLNEDFFKEGRTLKNLGLEAMELEDIIQLIKYGE